MELVANGYIRKLQRLAADHMLSGECILRLSLGLKIHEIGPLQDAESLYMHR